MPWNFPSHLVVVGRLVFWFGLFLGFVGVGEATFFPPFDTWSYVGWDGMRMGKYVAQ